MELGDIVLNTSSKTATETELLPLLPDDLNIGRDMHSFMSELQGLGKEISKLLDQIALEEHVQKLLQEYINEFSSQKCRIAVIGQMKAGKSAFINALIGRGPLLPSDVNPWTTVVTRLHFGDIDLPNESAEFSFFGEQDWQRIAQGGGKLRELVERFLPGFEEGRLKRQLDEMRTRAEQRLGQEFGELLGQSHWFDNVSPDIIRKYVCAGDIWSEDLAEEETGRFSDITEAADIFLKPFPFAFPATVIDTPGTNDPFFVRDEITCQNLDKADMFIVVLHAQQALSMTDLGLLRILQGLNKDRIIVFINRIDQLNNWEQDAADIKAHVEYMLKSEFPTVDFPVIVGSAIWGQKAWDFAPEDVSETHTPMSDEERAEIFNRSGIPEVSVTASRLMIKGKGRSSVTKIISNLSLAIEAVLAILKNKKQRAEAAIANGGVIPGLKDKEDAETIESQIMELNDLSSKVSYSSILFEKQLDSLKDSIVDYFRTKLNDIIIQFADSEALNMIRAIQYGQKEKVWRCDTMKVRRMLESEFQVICREAAKQINAAQNNAVNELRNILKQGAPSVQQDFLQVKDIMEGEVSFSTMALNQTIALDLDNSWWRQWWSQKKKHEEWANELVSLIKDEFEAMVERLVVSSMAELSENTKESLSNYAALNSAVVSILQQKVEQLNSKATKLLVKDDDLPSDPDLSDEEIMEQLKERVQHSSEYIKIADDVSQRLLRLQSRYQLALGHE